MLRLGIFCYEPLLSARHLHYFFRLASILQLHELFILGTTIALPQGSKPPIAPNSLSHVHLPLHVLPSHIDSSFCVPASLSAISAIEHCLSHKTSFQLPNSSYPAE